ncbi:MAG: two-component system response regulator CreB [Gammaproteobacteria bacterium]
MTKPRILLLEDEAAIADNVVYALETEGFEVVWKRLGREGLEHHAQNPVDLLILDVGLPDVNGFEVCKSIRRRSEVPVIFLTARSGEIDRVVGLEIGGDDYVAKPFSPRELTARVKAVLKRSRPAAGRRETDGCDFVVDGGKAAISYLGVRLELTRYEYLILKTLLHRPEQVYSRSQLMDLVWDDPDASFDRAVDTHIKTLRAKLSRIGDRDPIKTHRGLGYSIEATRHEV